MAKDSGRAPQTQKTTTKWEQKAGAARSALVEEAVARLIGHGIDGVASIITPSALARESATVSVDTAYRLLGSPEETLALVVERTADTEWAAPSLGWASLSDVTSTAIALTSGDSSFDTAMVALRHFITNNLSSPALALGRLMDAAAMTASPEWKGALAVREEQRELATEIIAARGASIRRMNDYLGWMIHETLAELRRRPKAGWTTDSIGLLIHSLVDGAVSRMLIDPGSITVEEIAEAAMQLGLALTEDGSMIDPNLPDDPASRVMFNDIVSAADVHWAGGGIIEDIRDASTRFGFSFETVVLIFPAVAYLADSVVRSRTQPGGISYGEREPTLLLLTSTLRRLAQAADEIPEAVRLASTLEGTSGVLSDIDGLARALTAEQPGIPVTPDRFAKQLIGLACQGTAQLPTIDMLLDMLTASKD